MSENEISVSVKKDMKSKVLGTLGGSSTGLGTFGAVHNVCHYTCQGIIALLAIFGISAVGMPLGFLLDPTLVVIFSSIGLASITSSILLHIKHKKSSCSVTVNVADNLTNRRPILADKKLLAFLALGVISAASLVSGVNGALVNQSTADLSEPNDMLVKQSTTDVSQQTLTLDSPTKMNSDGDTTIAITYVRTSNEGLIFTVSMDTSDMEAPSLAEHDLTKLSYIVGSSGTIAKPLSWNVEETGHMGHHLKGTLVFPIKENNHAIIDDETKSFEIVVNDVAGIDHRAFSWEIIATSQPFSDQNQTSQSLYESSASPSLAPAFTLPSTKGGEVSLSDYAGKKNVLLYFQEGIMCAPCWEQVEDIQKVYDKFQQLDIEVLTITVDPMNALKKESAKRGIMLPVLEDADLKISTAYDVLEDSMHPGSRPGHTFVLIGKDGEILWKKAYFIASGSTEMTMQMPDGSTMTMNMGGMDMGAPGSVMYVPVDELLVELNKVFSNTSMSQMETGSMEGMVDHSMCLTPIHNHADFKVYLNGNPLDLSQRKYMDQDRDVHFHPTVKVNPDDIPGIPFADMVHIHKENLTVRDFLNTLDFDTDTLKMLNDEQKLKVYANGELRQEGLDYVMHDKDRILVSYGSETESQIAKQIESVTNYATMGRDKNPSLFGGC